MIGECTRTVAVGTVMLLYTGHSYLVALSLAPSTATLRLPFIKDDIRFQGRRNVTKES